MLAGGFLTKSVNIVFGKPGTGKTTLIRSLHTVFHAVGQSVCLAAPTGRAARRLSIVVPVAVGLIFLLLFSTFRSVRQALLVLTSALLLPPMACTEFAYRNLTAPLGTGTVGSRGEVGCGAGPSRPGGAISCAATIALRAMNPATQRISLLAPAGWNNLIPKG